MDFSIIDITDPNNHNNKSICGEGITFFSDEWNEKKDQCLNFSNSANGKFEIRVGASKCKVRNVAESEANEFIDRHHIQGKNKLGLVFFGIFHKEKLLGVMSLGRHHRNNKSHKNVVVLDRLCFKHGVQVIGGATRLFHKCTAWAKDMKYDRIISFSDNRITKGKIYENLKFSLNTNRNNDYCYYDESSQKRLSKQSQKKSNCKCPLGIGEREWAEARGFKRIWDKGKKTWEYILREGLETLKELKSKRCAEQHSNGSFKHGHIRGNYKSKKNNCEIYYASSYELRCIYQLENDPDVISYNRMQTIKGKDGWRSPDLLVNFNNGNWIFEVKPKCMIGMPDVASQINDSKNYCAKNNINFKVWTEEDSGLDEKGIVSWAKKIIAEQTGDFSWVNRQKENSRRSSKKHYHSAIKHNTVPVDCKYCGIIHNIIRRSYDKNIERNKRYICEWEGGSISGKKRKKFNPYEAEGKKQCNDCGEIKLLELFGAEKTKLDGRSGTCKNCRAKKTRERRSNKKSAYD